MNIKKLIKLFFILQAFITVNVYAESDTSTDEASQYNIEILIFEQSHQQGMDGEKWRKLDQNEDPDLSKEIPNVISLGNEGEGSVYELPPTSLTLADTREKLDSTPDYRVIYHKAWYQAVRSKDDSTAVWIETPGLEGTINLHKQRFLHFSADLNFDSLFGEVKLEQSRRLKSKELHYFDHPLFGMLVRVVKIEKDQT